MNLILFDEDEVSKPLSRSDERMYHIQKILKLKVGDYFRSGICNGPIGKAEVLSIEKETLTFRFEPSTNPPPPPLPIDLYCGIPRANSLRRVLKEATTLGARRIILFASEKGEKSYLDAKLLKECNYLSVLKDGASQTYTTYLPEVKIFSSLKSALSQTDLHSANSLHRDSSFFLHHDQMLKAAFTFLSSKKYESQKLRIAIGSERGWSTDELQLFQNSSFIGLNLGSRVMRTDTAFIAALSLFAAWVQS